MNNARRIETIVIVLDLLVPKCTYYVVYGLMAHRCFIIDVLCFITCVAGNAYQTIMQHQWRVFALSLTFAVLYLLRRTLVLYH